MRDYQAIDNALAYLAEAREIVRESVRGTNDWRYDWNKSSEHALREAKEALNRLRQQAR